MTVDSNFSHELPPDLEKLIANKWQANAGDRRDEGENRQKENPADRDRGLPGPKLHGMGSVPDKDSPRSRKDAKKNWRADDPPRTSAATW